MNNEFIIFNHLCNGKTCLFNLYYISNFLEKIYLMHPSMNANAKISTH